VKPRDFARRTFLGAPLVTLAEPSRLADQPQFKADFHDPRSRKVVLVVHCVLNQNARAPRCAVSPAMMKTLVTGLMDLDIGILQLPCPETMVLGLGRDRTVPPISIRDGLELPEGHARLHRLIDQILYQIREYQWQGFHVLGILGQNTSPSCGVETTWWEHRAGPGQGVFIRLLRQRLKAEGLAIACKGINEDRQQEAVQWVRAQLKSVSPPTPAPSPTPHTTAVNPD
jgi:predicted secreted protein